MHQHEAPVISNSEIVPRHVHMVLKAPEIARSARPGQFLHVRAAEPGVWDPLLRRPLSIFWTDPEAGHVGLLYRVNARSRALQWLSGLRPGQSLDVIGPLGEGVFHFAQTAHGRPVLVGGGIGLPPLYFLATRMAAANMLPDAFLGFSDSESVMWVEQFSEVCRRVTVTTQDGGRGRKGLVTEPVKEWIERGAEPIGPVYACGPEAMMRAVNEICRTYHIPSQLSLEERMACGVGACLSCVALVDEAREKSATAEAAAYARRKRICVEGPVFPGEAVIFS